MNTSTRGNSKRQLGWLIFVGMAVVPAAVVFAWPRPKTRVAAVDVSTPDKRPSEDRRVSAPPLVRPVRAEAKPATQMRPVTRAPDFETASFEDIEARWAKESEDAEWTMNATAFIRAALEGNDAGPMPSFTARCGTTLCRASFDGNNLSALVRLAKTERGAGISFMHRRIPSDGGYSVITYFSRGASDHPSVQ